MSRFVKPRNMKRHAPRGGWVAHTWYLVEVCYSADYNPVHRALLYTGFLSRGKPAGYNCIVPATSGVSSEQEDYNSTPYILPIKVLLSRKDCDPEFHKFLKEEKKNGTSSNRA